MNTYNDIPKRIRNIKKKRDKKPIIKGVIIAAAIILIIIVAVIVVPGLLNKKAPVQITESPSPIVTATPTTSPSPTVSATSSPAVSFAPVDLSEIKTEINEYIKNLNGTYGVYFESLTDGSKFGINSTEKFIAASTSKIPINLLLYKKILDGETSETTKITYLAEDYEAGTGSLQYKKKGTSYTVMELSKLSIEQSDNVAANMIQRYLGYRSEVRKYMKELGGVVADGTENISCPKDMALYLKTAYNLAKSEPELGGKLIKYLQNTMYNDRIPKLLPEGVLVAHKIGNYWSEEWGNAIHDVGIVYADKPYIIAVMSKNTNSTEVYDAIANISKKVYDFVSKD